MKNKTFVILIIALMAMFFVSLVGIYTGGYLTTKIQPGSMVGEASYIIFIDGTRIYAKNGTTGEIMFSSPDASNVINQAISRLPNGGRIFIQSGKYSLNKTILINKPNILLEGSYGGTRLTTTLNIPLIEVDKPTGNVNLGSKISNFVLRGSGRGNLNANGIYVNNAWGLDLENLIIGDCRNGIFVWMNGIKTIKNIMIEPIGELGLGNCYRGIFQNQTDSSFAGMLSMWDDIDIGYCESDAIYITRADSIWASNLRLIESGGHGLRIDSSAAASNFVNTQIDCMHGDALHLGDNPSGLKLYDTTFVGGAFDGAPSSSTGFSNLGIPSGLGGYGLWLRNGERVTFSSTELGFDGNGKGVWIENSWWITVSDSDVRTSVALDGITINSSSGTKIEGVTVDAAASFPTTGIHYIGSAPNAGTKIVGTSVTGYDTPINVSLDPTAVITASP